ncbi:MAG TPA: hypothetical protein VKM55_09480 [Candidatus Lokiarchaeia archaeon]|nr:hypothetical protein [Candidatus Lokiarchaeia archaeon]
MSGSLSVRIGPRKIDELDRLAKILGLDRATIICRIIENGIEREHINIGIDLFQKGETMDRAAEISGASVWDLIDEAKQRGVTSNFDIEQEKAIAIAVLTKNDLTLAKKISSLR